MRLQLLWLLLGISLSKTIMKGYFQFQAAGCCDPISTQITYQEPMTEIPQIILTIRALEYEGGPIAYFTSLMDVTLKGFTVQLTVPKGMLKIIAFEYIAINQDDVEFGFFNIDALGTLRMQQTGDATVPLFMRFKRHFVDEPLVQVYIVGFESETKQISFEVTPFSVAQNGVTLKINKYGQTGLTRLQVSYVATEQTDQLAQLVTHTGVKTATIGYEFLEVDEPVFKRDPKIQLVQVAGINGLRFMQTPVSIIWQGDKVEPTALNVNLRITLDKGNQAVLGLYYFQKRKFKKCPIIYSECGFKGSYVYVCRNIPDFERVFKLAKSVVIPDKSYLTIYKDTSYTGVKTKISEDRDCIRDWFEDVPNESVGDVQTLFQINRYQKHRGGNTEDSATSFLQKKEHEDYWQIQKQSFGVKMPVWYQYNKDGTLTPQEEPNGKKFEKVEVEDTIEQQINNEQDDQDYQQGENEYIHLDEQAMF